MARLTTPLVSLSISSGGRTSCWPIAAGSPIKVGPMVTVVMRDEVPEHTSVMGGIVEVAVVAAA